MRQSSSCLSWEPARCSTFSRSHSSKDPSELKVASYQAAITSKQQAHARPSARQWTSWTADNTTSGLEVRTTSEHTSSRRKSSCSNASTQSGSEHTSLSGDSAAYRDHLNQQYLPERTKSSVGAQDSIKTLPTRPKHGSGLQQNSQVYGAAEENKLRPATKPQSESACGRLLPLQRPAGPVEVNVARSRCHPRRRPCTDAVPATTPKLRRDTDCTEAIVRLIVFFSTKLVHTIWSSSSATPKSSKDFNGAGVLPLQVFIQETLRRSKTSYSTLQVALFYLILLRPHVKPCQAAQQQYTPGCRALQCGRRMFLTALILASKYLQDRNYSARAWSKISGLPVAEINENERHYLELIKYTLHMTKETFENWSKVVLSICKASGQGPFGRKPDSPPSSPDALLYLPESEQPGSSGWWLHHLSRLTPNMVKDSKATDDYLAGLAKGAPMVDSGLSLDTPPSSPESLVEVLSDHSSPLVLPSSGSGQVNVSIDNIVSSPASVGAIPSRPLPANLPTPQTTPRYDSACMFARRSSQSDVRCRASLQVMAGVDKHALNMANLETCPPPKPRHCEVATAAITHPPRESTESSTSSWMSSPESTFSDSSSNSTRSRSSSVSSVSSVWSLPGFYGRQNDVKQVSQPRTDSLPASVTAQTQSRTNIGSYSFYHPASDMHSIPENVQVSGRVTSLNKPSLPGPCTSRPGTSQSLNKSDDLSNHQIAQLLASLSSQSDNQIQERADPAVTSKLEESLSTQMTSDSGKKHKRTRSSKEDNALHDEIRQFLWDEQVQVYVEDDKRPTTYVEASDKEAQYPMQQWAHAKKPVPSALHNKRIALQHPSSPEQKHATELAADFLRHSVAVI